MSQTTLDMYQEIGGIRHLIGLTIILGVRVGESHQHYEDRVDARARELRLTVAEAVTVKHGKSEQGPISFIEVLMEAPLPAPHTGRGNRGGVHQN